MSEAAVHFRKVADELKASGALDPKVLNVDTNTLLYQVPGGMLSNLCLLYTSIWMNLLLQSILLTAQMRKLPLLPNEAPQ